MKGSVLLIVLEFELFLAQRYFDLEEYFYLVSTSIKLLQGYFTMLLPHHVPLHDTPKPLGHNLPSRFIDNLCAHTTLLVLLCQKAAFIIGHTTHRGVSNLMFSRSGSNMLRHFPIIGDKCSHYANIPCEDADKMMEMYNALMLVD